MYQHKVSLVVRYFMIPCNICLILLATSTLGFAVLLFLNNCRSQLVKHDLQRMYIYMCVCVFVFVHDPVEFLWLDKLHISAPFPCVLCRVFLQ